MATLLDQKTLDRYLKEAGVDYHLNQTNACFECLYNGEAGVYRVFVRLEDGDDPTLMIFVPNLAYLTGGPRFAQVLAHLLALNYRLALGSFERDARDGEVRFYLAVPLDNGTLSAEQFRRLLFTAYRVVDQAAPLFAEVDSPRSEQCL